MPGSVSPAFSVFLIKAALISVRPQEQLPDPRRGTLHLFADRIKAHALAALDDDLVMHMGHYPAIPQGLHGMA